MQMPRIGMKCSTSIKDIRGEIIVTKIIPCSGSCCNQRIAIRTNRNIDLPLGDDNGWCWERNFTPIITNADKLRDKLCSR